MKPFLLLVAVLSWACVSFAADLANDDPRIAWGIAQASAALEQAGLGASQLDVSVIPASTEKPEGYRLTVAGGKARVAPLRCTQSVFSRPSTVSRSSLAMLCATS